MDLSDDDDVMLFDSEWRLDIRQPVVADEDDQQLQQGSVEVTTASRKRSRACKTTKQSRVVEETNDLIGDLFPKDVTTGATKDSLSPGKTDGMVPPDEKHDRYSSSTIIRSSISNLISCRPILWC